MKIFVDSGNFDEIKEAYSLGFIDGATTNPMLTSKFGKDYETSIKTVVDIVEGKTVFSEVLALTAEEMYEEGKRISSWGPNMIVKLPSNIEGARAGAMLKKEGVRICFTLVYSVTEAIFAAKIGAEYVAPFMARSCQVGVDGMSMVGQICAALDRSDFDTKIIGASLKTPMDVSQAVILGIDDMTLPYDLIKQCLYSPLTEATLGDFLNAWNGTGRKGIL